MSSLGLMISGCWITYEVEPTVVVREWDYGAEGEAYPCWAVLDHVRSNTGIANLALAQVPLGGWSTSLVRLICLWGWTPVGLSHSLTPTSNQWLQRSFQSGACLSKRARPPIPEYPSPKRRIGTQPGSDWISSERRAVVATIARSQFIIAPMKSNRRAEPAGRARRFAKPAAFRCSRLILGIVSEE